MDVSIVIPVYNVAPYIERCLSSVMRQTYEGTMECVVVDDCGTDDSIDIAKQMIGSYDGSVRFEILHHEHNRGLSAARNAGTLQAQGDYIFFLDSDDEIADDCIEKLMAPIAEDDSIEVVQGNYCWIKSKDSKRRPFIRYSERYCANSNEAACCCKLRDTHAWNKLIKKLFLEKYQLGFKEGVLWEDLLWDFYMAKCLSHFYYIPDVTYYHYRNSGSITIGLKRDDKIKYYAIVDNEIASHLTPGKEACETLHYLPIFMRHYLVANGAQNFQNAYVLFHQALSEGGFWKAKKQLEITNWITRLVVGRLLFELSWKAYHLYQMLCISGNKK